MTNSLQEYNFDGIYELADLIHGSVKDKNKNIRKHSDFIDEQNIEKWYSLFGGYGIEIEEFDFESDDAIIVWFEKNEDKFVELFDRMADEVFYILFANRKFLLDFNRIVTLTIKEIDFSK